jgi:RHS repeat-associated protein
MKYFVLSPRLVRLGLALVVLGSSHRLAPTAIAQSSTPPLASAAEVIQRANPTPTANTRTFWLGGQSISFQDVTGQIEVHYAGMRWNRSQNVWQVGVSLRNTGNQAIPGRILLAVTEARGTTGVRDTDNAPSAPAGEPPFWNLTAHLDGSTLASGASTRSRLVSLGRQGDEAPRLVTQVWAESAASTVSALALTRTLNANGLPLPSVTVEQIDPFGRQEFTSDPGVGAVTLGGQPGLHRWRFTRDGYLPVWRQEQLVREFSRLPSPRLTPRSPSTFNLGATAQTFEVSDHLRVEVRPNTSPSTRPVRATPLDAQAPPNPFPAGWHPMNLVWLEWEGTLSQPLRLHVLPQHRIPADRGCAIVRLDTNQLSWVVLQTTNPQPGERVVFDVTQSGAYGLVVADARPSAPPAPQPGFPLVAGPPATLDLRDLLITGTVMPPVSLASTNAPEVTAQARWIVEHPTATIPSGTTLPVRISERYRLADGSAHTPPAYDSLLTLFRDPTETNEHRATATSSLRPQRLLRETELTEALVQASIFPTPSTAPAVLGGTNIPLRMEGLVFSAPPGSLVAPRVFEVSPMPVESARLDSPAAAGLQALLRGFSGLAHTASSHRNVDLLAAFEITAGFAKPGEQIAFQFDSTPPDGFYVLARAWYHGANAGLEPVARYSVQNGIWNPMDAGAQADLPGLDRSGQYAVLRVASALGIVTGIARDQSGAPLPGTPVFLQDPPWAVRTDAEGRFQTLASLGENAVLLRDPTRGDLTRTPFAMPDSLRSENVQVSSKLAPPFVVSFTPPNNTAAVSLLSPIELQFSRPIVRRASSPGLSLLDAASNAVPARVTFSPDGTTARLIPFDTLAEATTYRIQVDASLTDASGQPLIGTLQSRFTTLSNVITRSTGAQLYSDIPDAQGNVRVIGSVGMAPPRKPVLFVNDTTGQTTTLIANADGSFTNTLPASLTDRLRIVLINPDGSRSEIPVGRQVFPDGSVALYSEGGRITNRNDAISVVLEVPPGAVLGRTRFKIQPHTLDDLPALTRNTPPEEATAFGAFDLAVEGDPVRGKLRVEVRTDTSILTPPPGKTRDDFTLYAASFRELDDAGAGGDATTPVYQYQSLLQPVPPAANNPPGLQSRHGALFAGLYAFIDPVGARIMLVGSVYYSQTEVFGKTASALFIGGRDVIQGTEVRVGGAVVRARARAQLNPRPFSLQGGELVVISEADGSFAFLVPEQGISGGHALIATHPNFPRQFGTGAAVRVDPLYPNAASIVLFDRGRVPDDAPPAISVSHIPSLPAAGTDAVLRVEATDDGGPATVSVRVDHTDPPLGVASAVQRVPGLWDVRSSNRSKVVLKVRAEDSTGNASEQTYVILFGEPPVPPRPPNDPLGPYVLFSDPDEGSRGVSPLQPVSLHFNEWIDPQALQSPATYFTLTPTAGSLTASFGESPQVVQLGFGGLRDDTEYTLTVQGLRDLSGQILDQNPATNSPPAEPFQLRFRTAPNVRGMLSGIDEGGGAVLRGSYAYVIDRRGRTLNRYDVSIPSQPRLVGERQLPGPPRSIALVPDYSFTLNFASAGFPSDQPGPIQRTDLIVVAGKTAGAQFGYLRIFDLREDFQTSPAIGVSSLSLDETALFGRMTWSAPYLVLAENTLAAPQVHVFNLQSILLADAYRGLDQNTLRALPEESTPGLDANSDGDFVDPGDRIPTVGRRAIDFVAGEVDVLSLNPNRAGPNGLYQLRDSGRFITDVALHGPSGHAVVLTTPGRDVLVQIRGYPTETNFLFRPTTIRSYVIGQSSPDTLVPTVISNAFGLEFPGWYPKRALFVQTDVQRLLLLNLISLNASSNSLRVIDASRPDALFELAEIPFPVSEYGLLQGAELDALGRIVLSTAGAASEDLILLDPAQLLLPAPASGPHPAILGRIGGVGTGVTPFALGAHGVSVGSLRSQNLVGQGPPLVRFLPPGTNTFEALRLLDPEQRLAQLRLLPDPATLPVAGQSTNAALPPNSPPFVWYLMAETPGGAGTQIQLAVLSLDATGRITQGTNSRLSSVAASVSLHRLSNDPHLDSFNVYVSGPIVLMADGASVSDIQRLAGQVQMLRAGNRVRIGIPESMGSNPVVGPFAGIGTPLASPPPNAPPVRLGASQSRPVTVTTATLTVDDAILIRTTVDRLNARACPGSDWLEFENSLDADISILIDGQPLRGVTDENGVFLAEFTAVRTVAGRHRLLLDAAMVPEPGDHTVEVRATRFSGLAPNVTLTANATIQHEIEIHQTFPIGHTIIQGVDLWDGHLAHSAQDISLPGRKVSLAFGRTYSSAGDSSSGPLGAGWTHSYNIRLVHRLSCGTFTVIGGEGSGNAFTDPALNPTLAARYLPLLPNGIDPADLEFFKPQIGYHSTLVRDRTQPDRFWFFTQEAIRHDFVSEGSLSSSSQIVFTLRSIREPSGNSLTLDYLDGDSDPATLDSVTERDSLGQLPKRAFHFEYANVAGESRIHTLRGFNHQGSRDLLGLQVRYAYDGAGNLTNVTRLGPTPETTRSEHYRYTPGNGPTGHNLVEYISPNGATTRYRYAGPAASSANYYAANLNLLPGLPPHEVATNVTHVGSARPGFEATDDQSYGFRFDFTQSRRYVSDPRGTDSDGVAIPDTEYTLNTYGATTRIRAPLGQESELRWATDHLDGSVLNEAGQPVHDVLMTWRRDPEGQEQFFEFHDGRGNLTRERTAFAGSAKRPVTDALGNPILEITQTHAYDATFNQRTNSVDAEGNITRHVIDPRTGNLLQTIDPEGHITRFTYRPDGDLQERIDARGNTTAFLDYDPYGNARRLRDPLENETVIQYDERSRVTDTRDTFKHHTTAVFDSLDRRISEARLNDLSGAAFNPSAITAYQYDAAGLVLASTNALGLVTRHFYDALNRQVRSEQTNIRQAQGNPETYVTRVTYDRAGNMVSETDARGVIRRHFYDALHRRVRTSIEGPFGGPSNGNGIIARLAYDRAGNLTNEVDLHGFAISHVHDALYRIVENHLPFPATIITTRYDRLGNRTRVTDPDGFANTLEYDRLSRVRRSTNAEGHISEFAYDEAGNRTNILDRVTGLITRTRFDAGNRAIEQVVSGPSLPTAGYTTRITYDDPNNQVTHIDARGVLTRTRRDGLDRTIETIVDPNGLNLVTRHTHDAGGNVLTVTDAEGGDVDLIQEYDVLGRVVRRTYAPTPDDSGPVTETMQYDPSGNVVQTSNRRGHVRRGSFDNLGRPLTLEQREPISSAGAWRRVMTTTYDDTRNRIVQTDPRGNSVTLENDELGRIRRTIDSLGHVQTVQNGKVDVLARTDRNGNRTGFTYDRLHRLRSQTIWDTNSVLQATSTLEYLDSQRQVRAIDRRGLILTTEHDALGRPVRLTRSGPDLAARYGSNPLPLEQREYDANGNLVRSTDGNGNVTTHTYDAANRINHTITGVGTPIAATNTTRYDQVGNVLSAKDPRLHGVDFDIRHTYDARYRRIASENALGEITRFRYDHADQLIERTEPLGHVTRYEYDELGALLAVDESSRGTPANAGITRFRYDPNGNLLAQQDANSNLVTRAYDALNRVTNLLQHTLPGTLSSAVNRSGPFGGGSPLTWSFQYDPNGNQTRTRDPRGQQADLAYDAFNRLVLRSYSAHAETKPGGVPLDFQPLSLGYTYDPNGNLIESTEVKQGPAGTLTERTQLEYDGLDRLISKRRFDHDDPTGRALSFTYDIAGNRTQLTDADGRVTVNDFDPRNRLAGVSLDNAGGTILKATFEWEPDSLLRRIVYPGGTTSQRTYDPADRLLSLTNATAGVPLPHSTFAYTYDANGNRTSQTEAQPGAGFGFETTDYGYDALNRLVRVRYGTAGAITNTYAPNGSRLTETGIDPTTGSPVNRTYRYEQIAARPATTFNGVNVLTRIEDHLNPAQSIDYDYDANLNQVARTQGADQREFRFDARDQMISASLGGLTTRFDYNADRLRAKKVASSGNETRYLYDQTSVILEYGDASTSHATRNTYDYGHALLAFGTPTTGTALQRAFYLTDGLGSTVNLVDATGALVDRYRYDAWGDVRVQQGTHPNPRLYTGHFHDDETDLHYFGARYYDDEQARFLTADPYFGDPQSPPSLHRYLYAHSNPLRFTDPTGFAAESGDPTDRWIAETREMLQGMDQRMEEDIRAQGPGAMERYQEGLRAAETLARMDEERQRMLQEAGLTEADLRNPVAADMARWQLAKAKRSLENFSMEGDAGTGRAVVAGIGLAIAQVVAAPFELGAGLGTLSGKLDVGAETTAGDWLSAAGDVLSFLGTSRLISEVRKVGTTLLSKAAVQSTATRSGRGAVIAEARRIITREAAAASKYIDDTAKRLADERYWHTLKTELEASADLLASQRKAQIAVNNPSVRRLDFSDSRFQRLDTTEELAGSGFNVWSDGQSAYRVLRTDGQAWTVNQSTGGGYFQDFVRGHQVYDRLGLLEYRGQGKSIDGRPFVEMQLHDGFRLPNEVGNAVDQLKYLDQQRHDLIRETLVDLWKQTSKTEKFYEFQWGMNRNGDLVFIDPFHLSKSDFAKVNERIDELVRMGRLSKSGRFHWLK